MRLEKLQLNGFRNYESATLEFKKQVVCFLGKNGAGKTNLLDAIHYLSFTKSALIPNDAANVKDDLDQFVIRGDFRLNGLCYDTACSYRSGAKKVLRVDGQDVPRMADHIGRFPVVMVTPNDIELIWDGSELRRRFFDSMISQIDRTYLDKLMLYNHLLKQRNSLLRLSDDQEIDKDLLDTYDQPLADAGTYIASARSTFVKSFAIHLQTYYSYLGDNDREDTGLHYQSEVPGKDFREMLKGALKKDLALQRTTLGIHRDDFQFILNSHELRKYGSQGQQKTFLIALKLAEFKSIALAKGTKPLLLLDDIFDKLDDDRIARLIKMVGRDDFGQLFITDARPDRSMGLLKEANIHPELFQVENGNVTYLP
ncbi:MAG: DNA replication/repair protein RecF [Cyclobacteriaceae bacterium]